MKNAFDRRQVVRGAGTAAALLAMPSIVRAQTPKVMKVGTSTLHDTQHEWMKMFAAAVETKTKGSIKVEIYPASQLGSAPRMIEGTQFGTIQAFVGPPEFLSGVDSRFAVLGAPFLFKDGAHANAVLQKKPVRDAVLALGSNKGLHGIGLFFYGLSSFNFSSDVKTLKNFEGKKIRVFASAIQTEPLKKLNATAVPMALSEVMPALQQGTIDGVMSLTPVFSALRFYDAAKYIVETDHSAVTVVTVASKVWYSKLSKNEQVAIDEAGAQADRDIQPWATDFVTKGQKVWTDHGGQLARLSAADQAELIKRIKPVGAEVTGRNPAEKALFEMLSKAAEA